MPARETLSQVEKRLEALENEQRCQRGLDLAQGNVTSAQEEMSRFKSVGILRRERGGRKNEGDGRM